MQDSDRGRGPGDEGAESLGPPALRAFFGLVEAWALTEGEQARLLGVSRSTLNGWKAGRASTVHRDTIERISYLLGIFQAINILLPAQDRADAWMRAPNAAPLFGGRSALERMTAGNVGDLYVVRKYLEGQGTVQG